MCLKLDIFSLAELNETKLNGTKLKGNTYQRKNDAL